MRASELILPREQIPHIGLDRPAFEVWEAVRRSANGFVAVSPDGDVDRVQGYLTRDARHAGLSRRCHARP